jgi:hypothetical protein
MASEPFFGRADISLNDGELFGQSPLLTVPAGKQLIIEYLDGSINLPQGQTVINVRLFIGGGPVDPSRRCRWVAGGVRRPR